VRPGDIVVDGGANAGLHAFPLAKLVGPSGLLIAFEPVPETFAALKNNVVDSQTEFHQVALSDVEKVTQFVFDQENPALSHINNSFEKPAKDQRVISVDCVTLDHVIGQRNVSFIKLDLEGADFLAIRGAKGLLQRSRPPIIFENSRAWAAKCGGYTVDEFFKFFEDVKYSIHDLHGRPLDKTTWEEKDVAFEFLALPKEDRRRSQFLLSVIKFFWREHANRPLLKEWVECIFAVRDAKSYMEQHHGSDWISKITLT
jgi:FkbM family methyltransferase